MSLTRVVIEDTGVSALSERRWMCEIETGQSQWGTFRTAHLFASSIEAMLAVVYEAYCEANRIPHKKPVDIATGDLVGGEEMLTGPVRRGPGRPKRVVVAANDDEPPDSAA